MHMADALVSPAVGATMWVLSGGLIAFCARKVKQTLRDNLMPMMGVLGAFIFAAQMINFTIPGTGSSGHLGGGLVLTVLLGPCAAFLVISSVLTVQAFFFADGGLLALGCNIFNLGVFPAFVAYPLVYRAIVAKQSSSTRGYIAAVAAAIVALQLGALGVVLETTASGISELPFATFILTMLPIHFAIGVVEGLITALVISFVAKARPQVLPESSSMGWTPGLRRLLGAFAIASIVLGGVAGWFASTRPDGLEWSVFKVSGRKDLDLPAGGIHRAVSDLQNRTAILPDYSFRTDGEEGASAGSSSELWPAVSGETSVSGIVGGLITLVLAGITGLVLKAHSCCRSQVTRQEGKR